MRETYIYTIYVNTIYLKYVIEWCYIEKYIITSFVYEK